ncbi:MAG: GNAT family N-acetyltransferase [Acidobacteriota bacterium]|jgi:GNAT superfamily N-acetyltransferase
MKPERLNADDAAQAIACLSAAFADYPVMRYTLADAGDGYDEGVRALMSFFCNKRLVRGWPVLGVRDNEKVIAAALISEPSGEPPPALAALRDDLQERIGSDAIARLELYERDSGLDAPAAPHYFLGVIGVHPDHQGRGLARILLEDLARMSESHPSSTGICLNTEVAENVPFYEHMGYRVIGHRRVETLETWCMFRPDR